MTSRANKPSSPGFDLYEAPDTGKGAKSNFYFIQTFTSLHLAKAAYQARKKKLARKHIWKVSGDSRLRYYE